MIPSLLARPCITRALIDARQFSLSPIIDITHGYKDPFFPQTVNSWNSLPNQYFPAN